MTGNTICSFCGKSINEDSEQNRGKRYLYCPCNHALIPKGSQSYKSVKGGEEKMSKKEKLPKVIKPAPAGKVKLICTICNKGKNRTQKYIDKLAAANIKFICSKCKKKGN